MNEPKPRRRGRPAGKVEAKRGTRGRDAQILRAAAAMLNLTPSRDCTRFGVTRQTLTKWMRGETSAPREVYVLLLDMVIEAAANGTGNINAAAEARLTKAIDERIAAALEIMARMKQNGGTK